MKICKHGHTERNSSGNCKKCSQIATAKFRAANPNSAKIATAKYKLKYPEKVSASNKKTKENNQDKTKLYSKKWYAENTQKAKEKAATYRMLNPEKVKSVALKWQANNKEKIRDNKKKWDAKNVGKRRLYVADNRERYRIHCHNRRAKIRTNGGRLSNDLFDKLFKMQQGKCACCKIDLTKTKTHLDHIMPIALDGANIDSNIQLLCRPCNHQKHAKHPIDFMQERGFLI